MNLEEGFVTGYCPPVVQDPNEIPEMTDPMGRHWCQPDRSRILVDATHAIVSRADFAELREYSSTTPSGVYPGKMWKAFRGGEWWLRWYGNHPDPKYVTNHARRILILEQTQEISYEI